MSPPNALGIEEIRARVGHFLLKDTSSGRTAIVACTQVCRAWQPSFEPLLWSSILAMPTIVTRGTPVLPIASNTFPLSSPSPFNTSANTTPAPATPASTSAADSPAPFAPSTPSQTAVPQFSFAARPVTAPNCFSAGLFSAGSTTFSAGTFTAGSARPSAFTASTFTATPSMSSSVSADILSSRPAPFSTYPAQTTGFSSSFSASGPGFGSSTSGPLSFPKTYRTPSSRTPPLEQIQSHQHLIRHLEFKGTIPEQYLLLEGCTQLQSLSIMGSLSVLTLKGQMEHRDNPFQSFRPFHPLSAQEKLCLQQENAEQSRACWDSIARFVKAHQGTLKEILVGSIDKPSVGFWNALATCGGLKEMELSGFKMEDFFLVQAGTISAEDFFAAFWRVCSEANPAGFEKLRINSVTMPGVTSLRCGSGVGGVLPSSSSPSLSSLRHLELTGLAGFSGAALLDLLRHCPQLESLKFSASAFGPAFPARAMMEDQNREWASSTSAIVTTAVDPALVHGWPNLKSLDIYAPGHYSVIFEDVSLARLLNRKRSESDVTRQNALTATTTMTKITLRQSIFGPLSFAALMTQPRTPHWKTLTHLDWRGCTGVQSRMIQGFLEQCLRLESFAASVALLAEDVRSAERGWTCLGLKELRVKIWVPCPFEKKSCSRVQRDEELGQESTEGEMTRSTKMNSLERYDADQKLMFEKLSTLRRLEILDLNPLEVGRLARPIQDSMNNNEDKTTTTTTREIEPKEEDYSGLEFELGRGCIESLGRLSELKELYTPRHRTLPPPPPPRPREVVEQEGKDDVAQRNVAVEFMEANYWYKLERWY